MNTKKEKTRYVAWSSILGREVWVHAYSSDQAKERIRDKVSKKVGYYDSHYRVRKERKEIV